MQNITIIGSTYKYLDENSSKYDRARSGVPASGQNKEKAMAAAQRHNSKIENCHLFQI